ncbi:lipoprotein [Spiroplasma monobiae]|uniref:Lipoprotein n=1 Tax=Spiroplasma monobiae MQ-1 TaxID=1336748 RepID=A0A2K9LV04_SPISQ|nr:lipoprotein [Spiroplasma monobiae]AUM62876.1 hypothetical protein SMONO_v1c06270 [Spiroplasma monobiae MQ-1]
MKKLLTLLGSVSLMTTTAQMAVACSPNYDQKDKDGNSILIQFLQSIDGKAQISSTDVLWKLINTNGPKNREKLTLDLLKMINLSILSNAKDLNDDSIYANYNLQNTLNERWTSLNAAVDRQISTEKDKYKKDYGKKWEKEWNKMLVNRYSVYQDDVKSMDQEFLENKYKSDILLSDTNNNASKALLDVLLNTDQMGVTWISSIDVIRKYNALERIVNTNKENDANIANYLKADLNQIAQIENSTTNEANKWKPTTLTLQNTDKELADAARNAIANVKVSDIKHDTPVSVNEFTVSDTNGSRAGFLSNSQRFFLDKFYTTQAPLAISEVVIPFSANGSFDNGVIAQDFHSDDGLDQVNNQKLMQQILGENSVADWNRWVVSKSTDYEKATIKNYDKLMTLSNSTDFTQDMRSVVYDFVLNDKENNTNGSKIDTGTTFDDLVKDLSRTSGKDNHFYKYDDLGRVYYIDSTGMHIVQIDGYKFLVDSKTSEKKGTKQNGLSEDGKQINSDTLAELNEFKKFNSLDNNEKVITMKNTESNAYKKLNSAVTNPYLHYLVNNSMLKGLEGTYSSFDIMSEVKTWSQVSSSDSSTFYWTTCVFDYFRTISNEKSQEKFIQQYISFETSDENTENSNQVIQNTEKWFFEAVSTKQSSIANKPGQLFKTEDKKWTDEINSKTSASGYPKLTLINKNIGKITNVAGSTFWAPTDNGSNNSAFVIESDTSYSLNYSIIIEAIENSYRESKNGGAK